MVRRSLSLSVRVLAWLVAFSAVIVVLFGWRLASGPISLAPLTPYLEAALSPDGAPLDVEIGATELRLAGGEIGLVGLDVRGLAPDGAVVFELPEVELELSPEALLLHGVLAPKRLAAAAPRLVLSRDREGRIGLQGLSAAQDEQPLDLGSALAGYLLQTPDPEAPLSYLRRVEIAGAELLLEDEISGQSFRAEQAVLSLERRPDALLGRLAFVLERPGHVVAVRAHGRHEPRAERIAFDVAFEGLRPDDLEGFDVPIALEGLDLALTGDVRGEVGLDGTLSPLGFTLRAGAGVVDLPELAGPIALSGGLVRGTIGADLGSVEAERLLLEAEGATLRGAGNAAWGDDGFSMTAELEAENVRAQDLDRFWPPGADRAAREWVVENITAGVVPRGFARIELRPSDIGRKPLREDAVSGGFDFEGLTIRYVGTMPPVIGVSGRASFTAREMTFEVQDGGIDQLRVQEGGTVAITGIGIAGRDTTQLEIALDIEGPMDEALRLLDYPPLGFAADLGLDPAKVRGRSRTDLRLGLPLHRETSAAELRVGARADLREVEAQDLFGAVDLREGSFALRVDRQGMDLDGRASVEAVPLDVSWRENFGAGVEVKRSYRLEGSIEEPALASLGFVAPVPLRGGFWFDVAGSERNGTHTLDAHLDLTPLAVSLPTLGWDKPTGRPGQLMLRAMLPPDGPLDVSRFDLVAAGLTASGRLVLERDAFTLQSLTLDRFGYQQQRGSARVTREDAALRVIIDAQSLDLDHLLESEAAEDSAEANGWRLPLRISARADELILRGHRLAEVTAELEREDASWRSAAVQGRLPGGGRLEATLAPQGAERLLTVTSSDAGELLRTLDQGQPLEAGQLMLNARIFRQSPKLAAAGALRIDDFTLVDAPLLARLLTLASLTGIGNLLGGQGIYVDELEIPFQLAGGVLRLDGGRLSGSQLGLTVGGTIDLERQWLSLNGTVVPIYTLNRLIGRIPVLGDFFTGSEGEGAFAATYSIEGPREEPQIIVNPLAVLAPGFIRELFSGLLQGTLEPPDMPDTGNR